MTRGQRVTRLAAGVVSCAALACALACALASANANAQASAQTPDSVARADTPAQNDPPPFTLERDVHLFVVQQDGSVVEDDDTVLRANTSAGVDEIAERYV
jgi:hypothetical protein